MTSSPRQPGPLQLSERQRINWLRLIRCDNVGPKTFRDLINRYGSAEAALEILPELTQRGGGRRIPRIPTQQEAEAELAGTLKIGAQLLAIGEKGYPPMLATMDQPPPLIGVLGNDAVFDPPAVAIVGARNASLSGVKMARLLARDLGGSGHAIISGLARGIDAAAHSGALETGTVAVLAGGLDKPYPQQNLELLDDIIAKGGAAVSEMPLGWEPRARDFPRRNRLIAGLALGLVVVEAAKRSGSLISARLAAEMGRLVFAVPGSPLDPRATGGNSLLKDGASIATEASDIAEQIRPLAGLPARPQREMDEPETFAAAPPPDEDDRARLIEALGPTPSDVDELIRHTRLTAAQAYLILLELELAGRLEHHTANRVSLIEVE